ncbi:MAG: PUA domain-containing protein [Ignisphaera sp.]
MLRAQFISKKEIRSILEELQKRAEIDPQFIAYLKEFENDVKKVVEEKFEIVVFGATPALFKTQKISFYMPTLYAINVMYNTKKIAIVPAVVVDEGAVNHLKNGADVMIPGIRKILKDFTQNSIVGVLDPSEKYFLVVGYALMDSTQIVPGAKGKAIKNVSHIDDDIWRASLQIAKTLSSS